MKRGDMVRLVSSIEKRMWRHKLPLKKTLRHEYTPYNDFYDDEIALIIESRITPRFDGYKIHTSGGKTGWIKKDFIEMVT